MSHFRSRFGGLWTDRSDAVDAIEQRRGAGAISDAEAADLRAFVADGFVVLPGAVSPAVIDALDDELERIWNGAPSPLWVEHHEGGALGYAPVDPRFRDQCVKLLDLHAHSAVARSAVFAPPIRRFLELVFERPPLAFQSLCFRFGSRQDIHRDTAFVKVSRPLELAASWIALEDVQPGSGELEYYVGSHALPDFLFGGESLWMPPDASGYASFIGWLSDECEARGLEKRRFAPKRGDALIWCANLAHGGAKHGLSSLTRKSLVTHYCPNDAEPVYLGAAAPEVKEHEGAYFSCWKRG